MPAPQLATAGITDRIQALSSKDSFTPFEVKALHRDIERLKAADASQAYMLSGMLYAVVGDYSNATEMHQKNLRLSPQLVGYVNYGVSLKKLGRLAESKAIFIKALAFAPGSLEVFEKIMQTSTFLLDYGDVEDVVSRFSKASPETDIEGLDYMRTCRSIMSHLQQLSIPLEEYKFVGSCIERALIEFGLNADQMHERLSNFDGVKHIYIEIPVKVKDAAQLVEINDTLVNFILENDLVTCWDKLIVNFVRHQFESPAAVA